MHIYFYSIYTSFIVITVLLVPRYYLHMENTGEMSREMSSYFTIVSIKYFRAKKKKVYSGNWAHYKAGRPVHYYTEVHSMLYTFLLHKKISMMAVIKSHYRLRKVDQTTA